MVNRALALAFSMVLLFPCISMAQESSSFRFAGYVKSMGMFTENPFTDGRLNTAYVHNRVRVDYDHGTGFYWRMDLRNRMFVGGMAKEFPGLAAAMDADGGLVDLSLADHLKQELVVAANIDRLVMGYQDRKVSASIGRQRINWGLSNFWNVNDVFNAYDIFDFDYEERPGTDAMRWQFETGDMSFFEGVVATDSAGDYRSAGLYRFNRNGYDLQFLGGYVNDRWLTGFGWAGSIGEAGFKGELRWSYLDQLVAHGLVFSIGMDRTYEPGWLVAAEFLHNGEIYSEQKASLLGLAYPYKNAGLVQVTRQFNPVWSAGLVALVATNETYMCMPSVIYSVGNDWEVMLTGISRLLQSEDDNSLFLRLRWSFSN